MKWMLTIAMLFMYCGIACAADTVIVHKDPRADMFAAKQASVNKLTAKMTSSGQYRGYRIQVLNTRSREDAFRVKAELMQKFPGQKAYIIYQSPYFKVRLGNFPEKDDAVSFRDLVIKKYPEGVYVVEDLIEYTPKEVEEP